MVKGILSLSLFVGITIGLILYRSFATGPEWEASKELIVIVSGFSVGAFVYGALSIYAEIKTRRF